jgi:hypothetical protein
MMFRNFDMCKANVKDAHETPFLGGGDNISSVRRRRSRTFFHRYVFFITHNPTQESLAAPRVEIPIRRRNYGFKFI